MSLLMKNEYQKAILEEVMPVIRNPKDSITLDKPMMQMLE